MMYLVGEGIFRSPDLHPETITYKYKLTATDGAQTHDHPDMQTFALTTALLGGFLGHVTFKSCYDF